MPPEAPNAGELLTSHIKAAADLAALERLEAQHGGAFNYIHAAAAFTQAAHLAAPGAPPRAAWPLLLRRLWRRLQPQLSQCGPQALANTVWACGKLGFAEAPLLDACLARLCGAAPEARPQALANALYAAALLWDSGFRVDEQQARQLVAALVERRHEAKPQDVSNTLWAAATMGLPLPEQQARRLVAALVERRQEAKPQALSNMLWAVATMGLPLPEQLVWQLVVALVERRQEAVPQNISNTLWAAATMGLPLPEQSWERLLAALAAKAPQAAPQEVANALWAAAKRKAEPGAAAAREGSVTAVEAALMQLAAAVSKEQVACYSAQGVSNSLWALSELRLRPPGPTTLLAEAALQRAPAMAPQDLSNTALALARLGVDDARLFAALASAAAQHQQQLGAQDISNLAWAAAVADQRQLSGAVAALCGQLAGSSCWGSAVPEHHWQLWQVHLWLRDGQPTVGAGGDGSGGGLAGALSAAQLQQCAAAWEASLQQTAQQRRSELERRVFECARRLPCLADCRQEARTPDGAFSVDVAAAHAASGRRLAIEADGPWHFMRSGREPTGETLARNRALAARGFVVVSVPWWEWQEVRGDAAAQDAYLLRKVEAALSARRAGAQHGRHKGGFGGRGAAATDAAALASAAAGAAAALAAAAAAAH
ncbi:MAG: hypothetical protein J3K34DRAFT_484527 [Monoraphidium minutum]|nr:MAG: hypothetical protein J3K34DRAFT_484527 [Monoraphidium minutum]